MSKNLAQVFAANPITTIGNTDVIYVVTTDTTDAAISGANLIAQFQTDSPLTTKGDLYTYSTVSTRLGVGSDGQILQSLASQATGLQWTSTLSATVQGNITTVGTIGTGTWHGTIIGSTYGGTGVNNGASTITIGGNLTYSGAFTFTGATQTDPSDNLHVGGFLIVKKTTRRAR